MKLAIANTIVATAIALTATQAIAGGKLQQPGSKPMSVKSVTLAIKSPKTNACPATGWVKGWIHTSKPGKVTYMIARRGGSVSMPKSIQAKKVGSKYVAYFSQKLNIVTAINTHYSILVPTAYGPKKSRWVPLKASCKIKLGA
ncbi:MAG: hypothetical protein AAF468_13660 [Pseudomonadota bacterium]